MRKVLLKEIAKVQAGNSAPSKDQFSESGIPFIRAGSLEFLTRGESIDECEKVNPSVSKEKRLKLFEKGSILFAKSGMSSKLGRIYMLPKDAYVVSHLAIIKIFDELVLEDYIKYFFQYRPPFHLIRDDAYPSIKLKDIENISIDLPNLQTQRQIVAALDKAQSIIDKRQKSIELLDELLRATFLEMFGNVASDKESSGRRLLGDFIEIKHGYAFKSKYFVDNGDFVLLTPGNFYEKGGFKNRGDKQKYYNGEFSKEYLLDRGDLLVAMTEQSPGLLGSPILIPDNDRFLHNQRLGLVKFKSNIVNKIFLYCLFNTKIVRDIIHNKATGLKVRHTSPSKIENIYVSIPDLAQQEHFEKIFNTINLRVQDLRRSKSLALNLFHSLLQRAFHGDLTLDIELQLDAFIDNEDLQAIEKDDVLIQLLIDRFEAHNMGKEDIEDSNGESENGYHFESLASYEKAKHALFHLLKKEKVVQQYDAKNNKTSLSLL